MAINSQSLNDFEDKKARVVQDFLNKFGAKATVTYKREAVYQPTNFNLYTTDPYYNVMYESVPVIQMEIREDSLRTIIERLENIEEIQRRYGPNIEHAVKDAMYEKDSAWREKRIRLSNPGVQLAWEKYQMMLKIAGGE